MNKGLARIIFIIVFLIPIAWYLFLQSFGNNNFNLELKETLSGDCNLNAVTIIRNVDSLTLAQTNYFKRVEYGAKDRSIAITSDKKIITSCLNQNDENLVLLNEKGVWGYYELSREGVDQLLTELDILLLQESYGKGVSR